MTSDENYMQQALLLAERGIGQVEPNPPVGAVMVKNGTVIGRGWHRQFGGPHAEIEALRDARHNGVDAAGATIYVTLEPCCHHGKTPPCTDAIIAAGISKVIAAMEDPFPAVAGKGIALLRQAGLEVETEVLEKQARRLLGPYIKLRTTGRPWVICKWAQTLDGRIATRTGDSQWISCEQSRGRVHTLRSQCDGIMVGAGTVLADDPLLTNRSGAGRQPSRIVLDDLLQLPANALLVKTASNAPLLVATTARAMERHAEKAEELRQRGAELLTLPEAEQGIDLGALLAELGRREWTRVLVEGGSRVLGSVIKSRIADELQVFLAPRILGGREGLPAVTWNEIDLMHHAMTLPKPTVEVVDCDLLLTYRLSV